MEVRPYFTRSSLGDAGQTEFYEAGYVAGDESLASVRLPAALVAEAALAQAELILSVAADGEIIASVGEQRLATKLSLDELIAEAARGIGFVATDDLIRRLRCAIDFIETTSENAKRRASANSPTGAPHV